uniref:RING-CH-type domain-containing protein n=1 Tax=Chromera velia CCMP2878 TaxID=1169474 RepID=A0A0G4GEZ3_9ALVE|mmetsp:Transcript_42486/g.83754  ORF Transcript_42486/g.83754 Transcript_42486/m.83754 type:complete len:606 (+) Transcript_42486:285-2102(+)|eukprot:Cvel_21589.t1-p1 / transcript=Cvel_21589.t1 / gene=Cvel_21589 / organism=Chromera_velia_CCMP2878 / gene_product=hypothetical protein / transcript_product=hypothetical protein / location=Cvel_scaffold2038:12035-13849(+) / protein_length=605 / sequence_SO=supercontig / SO=protein_coding / is_pseudo=false
MEVDSESREATEIVPPSGSARPPDSKETMEDTGTNVLGSSATTTANTTVPAAPLSGSAVSTLPVGGAPSETETDGEKEKNPTDPQQQPSSSVPNQSGPMHMDEAEEDDMCRYCFEGREDGPLLSPCNCAGGQKWVHLHCLRQWQRRVLVSQPTHPAFYEDDIRHQKCNVCGSQFTCPPPTRQELMLSFTGPELASLLDPTTIIASHEVFSAELERQIESAPLPIRFFSQSHRHWIRGVYLITSVTPDGEPIPLKINERDHLLSFISRIDADTLTIKYRDKSLRLVTKGALEGVDPSRVLSVLPRVSLPARLVLEPVDPPNCGDDGIAAVNLTRPIPDPIDSHRIEQAYARVCKKYPHARNVKLEHYIGGPCDKDEPVQCVVPGGGPNSPGWTTTSYIEEAIVVAHSRACRRYATQGDFGGGQSVRLKGLKSAASLNGQSGILLRFQGNTGRWEVRLPDGDGKAVKPDNLEPVYPDDGQWQGLVLVFWGDARWSRVQLLGEIARGHWGLCRSTVAELIARPPDRLQGLQGRLAFAPVTEMTEEFMKKQMEMARAVHLRDEPQEGGEGEDEEDAEELGWIAEMAVPDDEPAPPEGGHAGGGGEARPT